MAIDPIQFSELMNALQAAVLLVARLEPDTQQSARDASDLRATVERAAHVAQQLRTTNSDRA